MRISFLVIAASLAACSSGTPIVTDASVDVRTADGPAVDGPTADTPTVDTPAPDAPIVDMPAPDAPVVDTPAPDAPVVDTPAPDAPTVDAPAPDATSSFMALAPCNAESDYRMASTVTFGGSVGEMYSPQCATVRAGEPVTFMGEFGSHPLMPSTRGSAMNPIVSTSTGSSAMFRFPAPGFYPYNCMFHGESSGGGMAGVIRVIP